MSGTLELNDAHAIGQELVIADWVFAYGSLIWNPEINFESAQLGRIYGFHRDFCVRSTKYRGTPDAPGVVLGLDQGGSCLGLAYKLNSHDKVESIKALYRREMINDIYRPIIVDVYLHSALNQTQVPVHPTKVKALTFAANRSSESYVTLSEKELLERLRDCNGERGPNREYAVNTWRALKGHGCEDERLRRLALHLI
jgi:glutathione-specific gamma-glutamylcyclotransferase